MPSLSDCPVDLLLDNILPELTARDLLSLAATSRFFAILAADDTFWKRKLAQDFNFSGARTARTSGWKVIYKGLSKPKVYVWGNSDQGRLGLPPAKLPKVGAGKAPFPVRLDIPGVRLVDIIAGGWSFHALDSQGHIYVWGALDGSMMGLKQDGFTVPHKVAYTPLRLNLPVKVRRISCGRLHSTALDAEGHIWTFLSWGRPFRLISPLLDGSLPDATVVQVECGWSFSAMLTASGDVFVCWPFNGVLEQEHTRRMEEMTAQRGKGPHATGDGVIPCETWDLPHDPSRLPALPRLPTLNAGTSGEDQRVSTNLVKIAAMENSLIGLTNKGHVVRFDGLDSDAALNGNWEYLPFFSDASKIREHEVFSPPERQATKPELEPPSKLHITHISASFRTFVAYSVGPNGLVLMGDAGAGPTSSAKIIPSLQYKSIISVVVGDYHYGALTSDGKLYTWGAFSQGALGLGDPADIEAGQPGGYQTEEQRSRGLLHGRSPGSVAVPTEVRFDHRAKTKKDRFCYAVTAAGWHTGALVIDLEDGDASESDDESPGAREASSSSMPGHYPIFQPNYPTHGPGEMPGLPQGRGFHTVPFRIGLAGAGMLRRGGGHNVRGRGTNPGPGE